MMNQQEAANIIKQGKAFLGIELGSTRVKAVLTGPDHQLLAAGDAWWENKQIDGVWTYGMDDVWSSLRAAYSSLSQAVWEQYGVRIKNLGALGISAMMHGYLVFGEDGQLLAPFRTWRNTMTGQAAEELSELFHFHVPQRWSVAHLYQSILMKEAHVPAVRFMTTLSGYVHWQLTGQKVLGVGDASGMFPLDQEGKYDRQRIAAFDQLIAGYQFPWRLKEILPRILAAGEEAGYLTAEGAKLLDPKGDLLPGIPLCPPEGDAGTGMVATGAVAVRTGNVSAGTSIFAMFVLERPLKKPYDQIDMVATPDGSPVAMVHCNNGTSDLNAWVDLLMGYNAAMGQNADKGQVYQAFFDSALLGDHDAGGLTSYGYFSGEHITGFDKGCPLLLHPADSRFTFPNLARSVLLSSLSTLAIGMKLLEEEQVVMDRVLGHGGLYRTGTAGQRLTAAALNTAVSVLSTAGEGGAWGAAVLAGYLAQGKDLTLPEYLDQRVFSRLSGHTIQPDPKDVQGFKEYLRRFTDKLNVHRAAIQE